MPATPTPTPLAAEDDLTRRLLRLPRVASLAFLVLMLGAVALLIGHGRALNNVIAELSEMNTDNMIWFISQSEVEVALLQYEIKGLLNTPGRGEPGGITRALPGPVPMPLALPDAAPAPIPDRAAADLAFDVVYSRLDMLRGPMLGLDPAADTDLIAEVERVRGLVLGLADRFDDTTLTPEQLATAVLPVLDRVREDLRSTNLSLLRLFAERGADRRNVLRDMVSQFSGLAILLVVTLSGILLVIGDLYRDLGRKTRAAARTGATLRKTIAAARDAVILTDASGRITDMNPAAEATFGHPKAVAIGQPVDRLLALRAQPGATAPECVVGRADWSLLVARHRNGHDVAVELTVAGEADAPDAWHRDRIMILRDVSERIAVESTLRSARDAAERNAEARARFLAVMSHEMRTPLQGLIAALELLGRGPLSAEQRRHLGIAQHSSRAALQQVEDLLDLARREEGAPPPSVPFDPGSEAQMIVARAVPLAAARGSRIALDLRMKAAGLINGPQRCFEQALGNLVSNAVKFTRDGTISVTLTTTDLPDGRILLAVAVEDDGVGIAPEDQSRIFDDFETLDDSLTRPAEGTGLGLGIALRAVQRMGGNLSVDSAPGRGSRFEFTARLNRATAEIPANHAPPAAASRPLEVLLAEDNDVNRALLAEMIGRMGHRVSTATNGEEAANHAARRAFDAIIMDVSMPVCDGLEALRRIRAVEGPSQHAPALGLTAHAQPEALARFRAAGMDPVLTKPVRMEELAVRIAALAKPPHDPLVDRAAVADTCALLTPDKHETLIGRFETETAALIDRLHTLDGEERHRALHSAAGSAALVGAARLHRILGAASHATETEPVAEIDTGLLRDTLAQGCRALRAEIAACRTGAFAAAPGVLDGSPPASVSPASDPLSSGIGAQMGKQGAG